MTIRTEQRSDGKLTAVAGGSRYGKTAWTIQQVETKAKRLLVWDIRGDYLDMKNVHRITSIPELAGTLREVGNGAGRFVYNGELADINAWSHLAYTWGQQWPAVFIADEIADFDTPSKAPAAWGGFIRKGLYWGNYIYALVQRVQEASKTVWGCASVFHIHGFPLVDDRAYVARQVGASVQDIESLNKLDYIERNSDTSTWRRGKVTFK